MAISELSRTRLLEPDGTPLPLVSHKLEGCPYRHLSPLPPQVASRVDLQGLQVLPQCRPHDFQKPPHHSKPAARLTCRTTRLCCHSPVRQRPAPSGPEARRLFPAHRKDRGLVGQRLRTLLSRTHLTGCGSLVPLNPAVCRRNL